MLVGSFEIERSPALFDLDGVDLQYLLGIERWMSVVDEPVGSTASIVTATRDRPRLLRRAGASIIAQECSAWQWIVVNDGAAGSCDQVIEELADDRIVLVETGGVGLAAARNVGLDAAVGDYVCYLDDDNLIDARWLRVLCVALSAHPQTEWGYGARVVETPEVDAARAVLRMPYLEFPRYSLPDLREHNYIDANVVFHRRAGWRFDENTSSQSDWDLILQLSRGSDPLRVPAIAVFYSTGGADRLSRGLKRYDDTSHIRSKHGLGDPGA